MPAAVGLTFPTTEVQRALDGTYVKTRLGAGIEVDVVG